VRIALADGGDGARLAVLDRSGTMPGRGAYLCREQLSGGPEPACVAGARRRRGVSRTLRSPVRIDAELIESVGR
jgi:predicted RNA-binding protein YlxR (DUF448 family)